MTHDMPSALFYLITALVVLLCVWILDRYAQLLKCSWCREPYGIFQTSAGDLCWSCSGVYDHARRKAQRRRSLLRRIMGRAA